MARPWLVLVKALVAEKMLYRCYTVALPWIDFKMADFKVTGFKMIDFTMIDFKVPVSR